MSFYSAPTNFSLSTITPDVAAGNSAFAAANYNNIKAAIDTGKEIFIPEGLGEIYIDRTLELPSFQKFRIGLGSWLTKKPGVTMFHLMRNIGGQNGVNVNGYVLAGGSLQMNETGHPWKVGDTVYCEGFLGNLTLNGPKVVTAAVPGVSWTFAAAGGNPTNTTAQLVFTSRYNPIAGANFTRAANVVTVLNDPARRTVGDRVYIAGLGGANSFNGAVEVLTSTPGVSWTYASVGVNEVATGTAQVLGDREITFEGSFNGNAPNMTYYQWGAHCSMWGNISGSQFTILDARYGLQGRILNFYNCTDIAVPYAKSSIQCSVLVQFDSYCDRCKIGTAFGEDLGDDVVAWGVTSNTGPFAQTAAPTGPGNMGSLLVDSIQGRSDTGLLKTYAFTGYDGGDVKVTSIVGRGPVSLGDPASGVGGGTFKTIEIGTIIATPLTNASATVLVAPNAYASGGTIDIGRIVDTANAANTGGLIGISCVLNKLRIGYLQSLISRTSQIFYVASNTISAVQVNNWDAVVGVGGYGFLTVGAGSVTNLQVQNITHRGVVGSNRFVHEGGGGGSYLNVEINNAVFDAVAAITGWSTAGLTRTIYCNNVRALNMSRCFDGDTAGTVTIFLANFKLESVTNNLLNFNVAAQTIRMIGRGVQAPAGQWCQFGGAANSISIDCKECAIDMGANAAAPPAQLVPVVGDMLRNTNAVGPGTYGRTNAGAWQLVY